MPLENAGKLWTKFELELLSQSFDLGRSLQELAALHARTPYAIIAKLQELGKIVLGRYGYHTVSPDPWVLTSVVRDLQDEVVRPIKRQSSSS